MNIVADRVTADIEELRDIAEWFDKRGMTPNGQFLRDVANRYEIVSGAISTMVRRETTKEEQR